MDFTILMFRVQINIEIKHGIIIAYAVRHVVMFASARDSFSTTKTTTKRTKIVREQVATDCQPIGGGCNKLWAALWQVAGYRLKGQSAGEVTDGGGSMYRGTLGGRPLYQLPGRQTIEKLF